MISNTFNISAYLDKFKNLGLSERLLKELICQAVKGVLNIDLDIKNIQIKGDEVIFKESPAIKNAIHIKKTAILNKIKEGGLRSQVNNLR